MLLWLTFADGRINGYCRRLPITLVKHATRVPLFAPRLKYIIGKGPDWPRDFEYLVVARTWFSRIVLHTALDYGNPQCSPSLILRRQRCYVEICRRLCIQYGRFGPLYFLVIGPSRQMQVKQRTEETNIDSQRTANLRSAQLSDGESPREDLIRSLCIERNQTLSPARCSTFAEVSRVTKRTIGSDSGPSKCFSPEVRLLRPV